MRTVRALYRDIVKSYNGPVTEYYMDGRDAHPSTVEWHEDHSSESTVESESMTPSGSQSSSTGETKASEACQCLIPS